MILQQAIFLDRDGVINEVLSRRVKFVNQPHDFYLLPGAGKAIHLLNQAGFPVFVVTNQGGVGLGYMQEIDLQNIHARMEKDLAAYGAVITDIAYCPHRPQEGCSCRKPKAKMITDLAATHAIDLGTSFMVGDRRPDIEAGMNAGTRTVLVGQREKAAADYRFEDLLAFAEWVTKAN